MKNRPVVEHQITKGEWVPSLLNGVRTPKGECIALTFSQDDIKRKGDAKLIAQAPKLLQLVEMYVDNMKSNGQENSLPYQLAVETLNKILL